MKTKLSKCRRTLIPITDDLYTAMSKFRAANSSRAFPDSKILVAFAEAGARVWESERNGLNAPTQPTPVRNIISSRNVVDDSFPFDNMLIKASTPKARVSAKNILDELE